MNESGIYTSADLKPYQSRLSELKSIIKEGDPQNKMDKEERRGTAEECDEELEREIAMTKLMYDKWDACGKRFLSLPPLTPSSDLMITDEDSE